MVYCASLATAAWPCFKAGNASPQPRHKSHYLYYPAPFFLLICPRFCCTINHCSKGKNRDTPSTKRRGVNPFFVNSGEARKGGGRVNGYYGERDRQTNRHRETER